MVNGTALVFHPDVPGPSEVGFDNTPIGLEFMQTIVDGDIELISGFNRIEYKGGIVECVAFCNEHGKSKGLKQNAAATRLWEQAVFLPLPDVLVGNVLIVFGDEEFMEAL